MKKISAILLTLAILTTISTNAIALPEGAIARFGKGSISSCDRAVQFSPDGKLLAVATSIGTYLYDAQTHEEVTLLETTAGMNSVSFNPDGTLLASGSRDNTVKLWNPSTGQLIDTLTGHSSYVTSVSFNHDGTLLASGSYDGTVLLWDMGPPGLEPFDLLSPQDNISTNTTPAFDWGDSASENGLSHYELWIDGSLSVDGIAESHYTLTDAQKLSDGSHTWTVKAVDNNDNKRQANQTWRIRVDSQPPIIYGDVNADGKVTPADAALVMRHVVGEVILNSEEQIRADVTNDDTLSSLDVTLILQKITGLILEFPVQSTPLSH